MLDTAKGYINTVVRPCSALLKAGQRELTASDLLVVLCTRIFQSHTVLKNEVGACRLR
jgi:hypothetical protein